VEVNRIFVCETGVNAQLIVPLATYPLFVELLRGPLSSEFGWSDIYLNEGHVIEVRAPAAPFVALSKLRKAEPAPLPTTPKAKAKALAAAAVALVDTRLRPVMDRSALVTAALSGGESTGAAAAAADAEPALGAGGGGEEDGAVVGFAGDRHTRVVVDVCPFRSLQLVVRSKIVADALPIKLNMQDTGLATRFISAIIN
jgi:hypothetical protein